MVNNEDINKPQISIEELEKLMDKNNKNYLINRAHVVIALNSPDDTWIELLKVLASDDFPVIKSVSIKDFKKHIEKVSSEEEASNNS